MSTEFRFEHRAAYVEELADFVDPNKIWMRDFTVDLTPEETKQRDAGIALRQFANHLKRMQVARNTDSAIVYTPVGVNGTQVQFVRKK